MVLGEGLEPVDSGDTTLPVTTTTSQLKLSFRKVHRGIGGFAEREA